MTSLTDVRQAFLAASDADQAIKPPVRLAALVNITPSGIGQTIDGAVTAIGDRILLAGQTDSRANGIRIVTDGIWSVAADWANLVNGTLVTATAGVANSGNYTITTANPITQGVSLITFAASPFGGLAAETAARIAADNTLQTNITAEATTRASADTTEATARAAIVTNLAATGGAATIGAAASTNNAGATVQAQLTNVGSATGASNVGFTAAGAGAVARPVQDKLREHYSVFEPMSDAQKVAVRAGLANGLDVTAAIQAAITYAKTFSTTQTEVGLDWPAGAYNVTNIDFTGANRIDNYALGSVVIYGTSGAGSAIMSAAGASGVTPTTHLNFYGNFTIQIAAGGVYQYGIRWNTVTRSYQHVDISGSYSVAALGVAFSFDNEFWITPSNTSAANPAYAVLCEDGNTNRNKWFIRGSANGGNGVVMSVQGFANEIQGDFNNAKFGIQLNGGFGTVITAPYFESLTGGGCIQWLSNPIGTTVIGGQYEIPTNGFAFDLSTSQSTVIIAPKIKGTSGGSGRVAFKLGTSAYALNVISPDTSAAAPQAVDTISTGTWRGVSGGVFQGFFGPLQLDASGSSLWGAGQALKRIVVAYSASMTIDASLGNEFDITASNGTAFTINAPTNPFDGARITITIRNTSGGALGVITWNAVFKMSAWTSPSTAFSRSIDFRYDGTNWTQIGQTGVDVPN
jgi:hypothetical protein